MAEASPKGITKVTITDFNGDAVAGGTGGGPASIADGLDVAQGTTTDAAWVSGAGTVISLLKKIASSGAAAGLTDAQLRATPVPVSGTFWQATQPVSNVFDLAGGAVVTLATQPVAMIGARTAGGTATALSTAADNADALAVSGIGNSLRAVVMPYMFNGTSYDRFRGDATNGLKVQGTFWQTTQPVSIAATVAVSGPLTDTQLRASAVPVSGSFFQATQPVSIAATVTTDPSDRAGRLLGIVDKGKLWDGTNIAAVKAASAAAVATDPALVVAVSPNNSVAVTGTFWQATQPVSGTVTANQGTANTAANAWFTKITDGTSTAAVKAASTAAVAADPAQVVALSPNNNTLANALLTKTTDGTNTAAVKAASTAAAAADPALVVSLSPNSPATTELGTGMTTFCNTALTNTKTAVKAAAGKVHGWMIHNPSAATVFIQVWNVAIGSITVGTTAPTWVIPIPAGGSANVFGEKGITHSTEINVAATTTATGSTAPATAAVVSIFYV